MSGFTPVTWETVRDLLAETLAVESEDVTPESNFFSDHGGESIDLIDFGFRCRKAFGITPRFNQITASDWEVDETGALLPETRRRIEETFPMMVGKLPEGPFHWQQLFSIAAIYEIVLQSANHPAEV